jgi:hypothetical protein
MTKRKSKSIKSTVKAAAAKRAVTKSSAAAAMAATPPLIVLGFDEQQKPRGARFVDAKPDLVIKAADLMGFKVYQATPPDVAEDAKKLPLGRLYANGPGVRAEHSAIPQRPRCGPWARAGRSTEQERQRSASSAWPAPVLGRDRAWPSRPCPGVPAIRLVGGNRARPKGRHVHPAVPRLPAPSQIRPASQRHCADEPAY